MSELEIVKEVYAAINRNDIAAALQLFDPQIVRVEPPGLPSSGTYRGLDEMKAHFLQARNTWAEGSCTPEKFLREGNKIVVFVHVLVRLKNKTEWIDGHASDAFAFKNGKIIEFRTFLDEKSALEWAGIKS